MSKIKITYVDPFKTICLHEESGAKISTAPPSDLDPHGATAFSPTDLLAASLASCMLTLMGITAKKIGVDIQGCSAEVEKEMSVSPPRRISRLKVQIRAPKSFSEEIRLKLEKAASECPVAHALHPEVKKEIQFVWGF